MIRYTSLYEAKQKGILYHFTRIINFLNIINDNYVLKSSSITGIEGLGQYTSDSISLTRNFILNTGVSKLSVRFDINGDKLSNKYKIEPFLDNEIPRYAQENEEIVLSSVVNIKPYIECVVIKNTIFKESVVLLNEERLQYIHDNLKSFTIFPLDVNEKIFEGLKDVFNNFPLYFVNEFIPHNKLYAKI
jgi:hypothetical protein